jgi:hypothetical protein
MDSLFICYWNVLLSEIKELEYLNSLICPIVFKIAKIISDQRWSYI